MGAHSVPAGNATRVIAQVRHPARVIVKPIKQLFVKEHGPISESCFRRSVSRVFVKPQRKTDMCPICTRGQADMARFEKLVANGALDNHREMSSLKDRLK